MASNAQVQANRKNAQRSTGPRTAQGKAKVALNALAHGLTAAKVVAGEEDRPLFEALRAQLNREWRPGSVLEVLLLDRIAELIWQLRRVAGVEVQVIEKMPKWRPQGVKPETYPMAEAMARDLAKPNPTLLRVQMYQNRLERTLHRSIRELRILQIERQTQDQRDDLDDDLEDDDLLPAPLPRERLGEGMEREAAVSENADADASMSPDAPQRRGTLSPHLTSPKGEGPELPRHVFSRQTKNDKTKPIFAANTGPAIPSAFGPASVSQILLRPVCREQGTDAYAVDRHAVDIRVGDRDVAKIDVVERNAFQADVVERRAAEVDVVEHGLR